MSNVYDATNDQLTKKRTQAQGQTQNIAEAIAGGAQPQQAPAPAPSSNLGWVPKDHPLYGTPGYVGSEVTPLPGEVDDVGPTFKPNPNLPPELAQPTAQPQQSLGWVPSDHPLYGTPGYVGSSPAPTAPTPPPSPTLPPEAQPMTPTPDPGTPAPGTPPPAGTPGAPTPGQPAPPPTTVPGAFQQALLAKLTQDPNDVSTNTAEIKGAVDANRLAGQRSAERQRAMARERQVAQGITGGATDVELQGIEQDRGEREGAFEGNLVAKAAQDRRNELMTVLTLAGNQMTNEQSLALQKELAGLDATLKREGMAQTKELAGQDFGLRREGLTQQKQLAELDAAIRREGMREQSGLGEKELGLRGELGRGNLNLGLLGLLQNNDQFGKQLGFNAGLAGANLNQNALLALLGGL